ncbi:DUF5682 family protein [Promicromonospora sp. MEB111]|uniref:DUF5682 family protein n=1 Tax=Promicromonospora sp. MEB111 TaxID=3040301 RepID=UPI002549FF11|nr:DUF5682 family protein [Promicromonospora sp. MEB111]
MTGGAGAGAVWDLAPQRLRSAADAVGRLQTERGIYFAPVRHHSPACAVAVRAAIEELRPAAVLIEGPEEFTRLIPDLLHEATRPPIAVLSLGGPAGSGTGSTAETGDREPGEGAGFYPLASFSPEWVALHAGRDVGAELRFIDRSFGERSAAERAVSGPGGSGPAGFGPDASGPGAGPGHGPDVAAQPDPFARTLMSERYLAHSEAVATLARRLGCRDHDEVWDHLFESRRSAELADWRAVFDDVFAWAALARLDYEEGVLDADGSLDREARMSARVAEAAAEAVAGAGGPVLVVTGAFHTLALVEALSGAPEGAPVRDRQPEGGFGPVAEGEAWLVRYDHERLDGLRGYGAGMPSPGYYERLHAAHLRELAVEGTAFPAFGSVGATGATGATGAIGATAATSAAKPGSTKRRSAKGSAVSGTAATGPAATGTAASGTAAGAAGTVSAASGPVGARALAAEILVDVARGAVDRGHAVSLPQVGAAAASATRLADLRERAFAGRTDLLDAMRSCYVQDDGGVGGPGEPERPLGLAIAEVFGGRALGEVPPGSASPPLVRDVRKRVRAVRLVVDDSLPRTARLDARRTASHRAKRQVLALLDFVGAGFGQLVSGPDHVAGRGLGLITEEWQYCWTPLVEARLVEMVHLGATLEAVAVARLYEAEARLAGTGAGSVPGAAAASVDALARLVAQALVIGMGSHLPRIVTLLRVTLDTDRDVDSVVSGARRLLGLWQARVELGAEEYAGELLDLVSQALATAAYLVSDLGKVRAEDEDAAIGTLIGLRSLLRDAAAADGGAADGSAADGGAPDNVVRDGGASRADGAANRIAVERELARLRDDEGTAPAVAGALLALGFTDGEVADDVLVTRVRGALSAGADPGAAVRFLGGVMRAAPDLILHTPEMFDAVDDALRTLDGDAFLAVLPDLRRAFTWLRPTETHRLAKRVAERTGARVDQVDVRVALSEEDLATGLVLDRELVAVLERDGLAHWGPATEATRAVGAAGVCTAGVGIAQVGTAGGEA